METRPGGLSTHRRRPKRRQRGSNRQPCYGTETQRHWMSQSLGALPSGCVGNRQAAGTLARVVAGARDVLSGLLGRASVALCRPWKAGARTHGSAQRRYAPGVMSPEHRA